LDPISLHGGDEAEGELGDFGLFLLGAELETGGETVDVDGGVDDGEVQAGKLLKFEEGVPEDVDVDLDGVREVDEHVGGVVFATDHV